MSRPGHGTAFVFIRWKKNITLQSEVFCRLSRKLKQATYQVVDAG